MKFKNKRRRKAIPFSLASKNIKYPVIFQHKSNRKDLVLLHSNLWHVSEGLRHRDRERGEEDWRLGTVAAAALSKAIYRC